jgi:hypothetical protein
MITKDKHLIVADKFVTTLNTVAVSVWRYHVAGTMGTIFDHDLQVNFFATWLITISSMDSI